MNDKIKNIEICAVLMIGGRSTRMGGGIKSFIEFNNKMIFERILNSTKSQVKKIIINSNQQETRLKKYNLPIIKDIKSGYMGPLAGIHAAMHWIIKNQNNVNWLITIPGDTPFIPNDLILKFKEKMLSNTKIILAKSNNKTHPIIGAWHTSLYTSLNKSLDEGTRKILSWTQLHHTEYVNFHSYKFDPFFNINTKEDIIKAAEIEKEFL